MSTAASTTLRTLPELLADLHDLTTSALRYERDGNDTCAHLATLDAAGVVQEIRGRFFPLTAPTSLALAA